MNCPKCSNEMFFYTTVEKAEQLYDFYQCPVCATPSHNIRYKYTPDTCPTRNGKRHQFDFIGQMFVDGKNAHSIMQVDRCDLCGAIRETPRHTAAAGISGRIDLDDPRVKLLWNDSAMKRVIEKEVLNELGYRGMPESAILPTEVEV